MKKYLNAVFFYVFFLSSCIPNSFTPVSQKTTEFKLAETPTINATPFMIINTPNPTLTLDVYKHPFFDNNKVNKVIDEICFRVTLEQDNEFENLIAKTARDPFVEAGYQSTPDKDGKICAGFMSHEINISYEPKGNYQIFIYILDKTHNLRIFALLAQ